MLPEINENESKRKLSSFPVVSGQPLELEYNAFPIYLRLSAPLSGPFNDPDYYYKIKPIDSDWHHLGQRREIQLLNLSPGSYSILLAGGKYGKIWDKNSYSLEISVNPPWWKSSLALLIYGLISISLLFLITRLVYRRKLALQESLQLRKLEESKSRFYANITHEFRTPLTVILGMTDQLRNYMRVNDKEMSEKSISMINRNGNKLLDLVNQLLDMTKLSKGHYNLDIVHGNIVKFITYQVQSLQSYAELKGIRLISYFEDDNINMDFSPRTIERILNNLISNAVKFSKKGEQIVVHVKKNEDSSELILKVKDEGCGIPEHELERIFDRFYQVEDGTTRNVEGSGIGLALVNELVKRIEGQIFVKSKIGYGTEFTIILPISSKAIESKVEGVPEKKSMDSNVIHQIEVEYDDAEIILIVEDNKDIAQYIATCIQDRFTVRYCENGLQGSQVARELLPDIIISDIMMPEMDGFELCKAIKQNTLTNHIPVILLSARTDDTDRLKGLQLGADAYLKKPFNQEELNIRIDQLIHLRKEMKSKYSDPSNWVISNKGNQLKTENHFLERAIKSIFSHIDNNEYRSIYLARDLGVSETQLYRKLKALTGKSTALFIRSIRLKHAVHLLQTSRLTISEIAYETGFSDTSYFSRVFKEEYNMSPSEWRQAK